MDVHCMQEQTLIQSYSTGSTSSFRKIYEDPIVRSHQPGATREETELGQSRADEVGHLHSSSNNDLFFY